MFMASTRKKATKDGQIFYEIRVSRGRGKSYLTTRWYPPEGWSQKAIDRALTKEASDFERRCREGEVVSRAEQKENSLQEMREAAKILTLKKFGEEVFMPAKAITMNENGRCAYQGNLDHWIYPALGNLKMPDITPANISALLLSMQSQGKAHATCVKVYTICTACSKWRTCVTWSRSTRWTRWNGQSRAKANDFYSTQEYFNLLTLLSANTLSSLSRRTIRFSIIVI